MPKRNICIEIPKHNANLASLINLTQSRTWSFLMSNARFIYLFSLFIFSCTIVPYVRFRLEKKCCCTPKTDYTHRRIWNTTNSIVVCNLCHNQVGKLHWNDIVSTTMLATIMILYEPCYEKTCLTGKTQTGQHTYIKASWSLGITEKASIGIETANNKGADQTARICRLICAFVIRIWHKQLFLWHGSYRKMHGSCVVFSWMKMESFEFNFGISIHRSFSVTTIFFWHYYQSTHNIFPPKAGSASLKGI